MRDLTDSDGLKALKWSFLFLGRAWDRAHEEVWPFYVAATLARQEGERNYSAEAKLFELMLVLDKSECATRIAIKIRSLQAGRSRYDQEVLAVTPCVGDPIPPPPRAFRRWARYQRLVDGYCTKMYQALAAPPFPTI